MISVFLAGLLVVFLGWTFYYRRHWRDGIRVELSFGQDFLYAGEQTFITEKIENAKRLPVPILAAAFQIRKEIQFLDLENTAVSDFTYKRDVFSVLGNQRIIRKLPVECKKRGYYQIEKVDFTTYSLFHTWLYTMEQPEEKALYVYARRTDVSGLVLSCEKMLGARQCGRRLYEDPFAFRGIREYTIRDPMKTINWKASAKSGELMVNTFDSTLTERVMIYLNVADEGIIKHENLIEEGISVAATLAQKLIGKGMEVGIGLNAEGEKFWISPAGGRGQLTSIERMLAELDAKDKVVPFSDILAEMQEDTMPVFISRNTDGAGRAIAEFIGKEREGIWVVPVTATEIAERDGGNASRRQEVRPSGICQDLQQLMLGNRLQILVRKVAGV